MTVPVTVVRKFPMLVSLVLKSILRITHNSFAILGVVVVALCVVLYTQPDIRQRSTDHLMSWLRGAQPGLFEEFFSASAAEVSDKAMAIDPKDLPAQQAALAFWLSRKYRVAPEPVSALIAQAYAEGLRIQIDPTLILAVVAIESRFNPFAQSSMGAQGLMQVMTHVHWDKYRNLGGEFAAFDPVANLRVGTRVLQDCITRAGHVEGGLRCYVGAGNSGDDKGYAAKVLAEMARLREVAAGRSVAANANIPVLVQPSPRLQTPTPVRSSALPDTSYKS